MRSRINRFFQSTLKEPLPQGSSDKQKFSFFKLPFNKKPRLTYTALSSPRSPDENLETKVPNINSKPKFKHPTECVKPQSLYTNHDLHNALTKVKENGAQLEHIPVPLRHHPAVISAAVTQYGMALQFIEHQHQSFSVVMTAVSQQGWALNFAAESFINNPQIAKQAIQENPMVYLDLIKLNCELIQDHDFNQAVLETNGLLLRYLPTRFRENRELVKLAVQQNGMALRCAKADLRDNTTVVHLALQQNGLALEFASAKLRADANTVLIAVIENGNAIMHCERSLREDLRKSLHLWTQALSNAPEAKRWLPYEFYSNPGIKAALETSAIKLTKPQQPINIIDDYFSNQPTSHETNALSPTPLTKHTLAHHTEQKKSNRDYLDDWAEKENKKSRSKSNNTVTTSSHKHYSH